MMTVEGRPEATRRCIGRPHAAVRPPVGKTTCSEQRREILFRPIMLVAPFFDDAG